jgi:hypothetical protein
MMDPSVSTSSAQEGHYRHASMNLDVPFGIPASAVAAVTAQNGSALSSIPEELSYSPAALLLQPESMAADLSFVEPMPAATMPSRTHKEVLLSTELSTWGQFETDTDLMEIFFNQAPELVSAAYNCG